MMRRWLHLVVVLIGLGPVSVAAAPDAPLVRVELLSEVRSITPGETYWIALRQRITPGWHTYWVNPGDSGEPLSIKWTMPPGLTAGEIVWPYPERIPQGPAMSYGYTGEVILPIPITAARDLKPGTRVRLRGQATWIVCEKICIPEESSLTLTLPIASGAAQVDRAGAAAITAARRTLPTSSPWGVTFTTTSDTVTLAVAAPGRAAERMAEVSFFPARWGAIEHAAPQRFRAEASGFILELARGPLAEAVAAPIEGVLVVAERLEGGVARHAFAVRAEPAHGTGLTLLKAAVLALVGGLVLNLMPCVLPVLSVKALGLVQHAGSGAAALRWHGIAYTAGVLVSFAIVAGALVALRAGGELLGWGYQLQSPTFVTLLAWVFFVMALSLSGAVTIGGRFTGAGQVLAGRAGYIGSFFTGALATVAATPCTAPFMGAAIGYALVQPWTTSLLVFEALGLGLALPYLLLAWMPDWRSALPRPGPWMERLKEVLAFPLYASAAWLVWVVSQQAGPRGVATALAGMVMLGLGAWLYEASRETPHSLWRRVTTPAVGALVVGAVALALISRADAPAQPGSSARLDGWEPYSAERLAELRAAGKPVFVNFTAAWCLTCLVNERVALRSPAVTNVFAGRGVATLKADWTTRDPAITNVLGAFGRSGVPLYVLYAPRAAEATVLPQILSEGIVVDAIGSP